MPLGVKPVCALCKVGSSTMWSKGEQGEIICHNCTTKQANGSPKESNGNDNSTATKTNGNGSNGGHGPVLRKSSRNKPSKYRIQNSNKHITTKGKSRRITFKKSQPIKGPTAVSTIVTGESVFHDSMYYQTGDIVSLVDDDSNVYYAQIRGFLQDQYFEKSAVITWLLPTRSTKKEGFDPSTYILGPEEELPRKLEYMQFVCHAPSDYFKSTNSPYPTISHSTDLCYIWSHVGPEIRPTPSLDEIFGMKNPSGGETPTRKTKAEKLKEQEDREKDRRID